jgi:hypothetical protein
MRYDEDDDEVGYSSQSRYDTKKSGVRFSENNGSSNNRKGRLSDGDDDEDYGQKPKSKLDNDYSNDFSNKSKPFSYTPGLSNGKDKFSSSTITKSNSSNGLNGYGNGKELGNGYSYEKESYSSNGHGYDKETSNGYSNGKSYSSSTKSSSLNKLNANSDDEDNKGFSTYRKSSKTLDDAPSYKKSTTPTSSVGNNKVGKYPDEEIGTSSYRKTSASSTVNPLTSNRLAPSYGNSNGKGKYDDSEDRDKVSALRRSPVPSYDSLANTSASGNQRVTSASSSSLYRSFSEVTSKSMSRNLDNTSLRSTGSYTSLSTADVKERYFESMFFCFLNDNIHCFQMI